MKRTLSILFLFFGLILGFSQMNGASIKWFSKEGSHFYFDTPDITGIPFDRYPQVKDTKGRNIVIPYKAVVKGQKEFIGVRIIIEDSKLKEAKIEFKVLGSGKLINAELVSNTGNQREYNLELKGVFSYGEEEIMAVLLPNEKQQKTNKEDNKQKELKEAKQKIIGSFRLVYLEPKNVNLSLVPLDKASEDILDTIAENIHNTYSKAGINFDIKKQSVLDISTITTKDIETPDDNPLSHYSKMQQSINRLYPAKNNEYVLFITVKASSTGQKGFMPLGGQYGYVYKSKDKNTPAHELGHGVFRLEHPWSNKLIKTPQAATNLLMDYAGGAELSHFDWKQINDPKIKIYAFQKQEEGEFNDVRLTPDWIPFEYHGSSIHGNNSSCKNNGGICSIEKNGQQYSYISTQRDYINGNDTLKISIVNNPEYVIVVDYSVGCGKLYKVKFKDLQANFNKDSHIDFNDKIFSHYGDVSCIGKTNDDTEGEVVDYSGKISKEELQKIIKSLNVTSGETGIKGKIFITNASDQQKIEKVKSILKDLEKSSKKEIYLWANYVDEKQFTIDFTVGGGIENRENIIKNRAIFKKISVSDLSWGGDFNPLTAIFDGLAYLVSYLEIPPKFYDPTVEGYNPFLYEADKAMSQFTPSDILAKEIIKKSGIKTEKGVTPKHLTFAYKAGQWNGLVGTVKSIPELASLISKGIQLIYDEEFRNEFSNEYEKWKAKCDNYNDSDTYVGCAWDMLLEKIKQAHTTGSSPQIAQQYGKSTFDLITIPFGMVKAGKLGKINKIIDLLDPISNTMKIAGKTVKVTFNTTRRTFKYVINTAGKNFKRYELRFKIDGNTLYCGIPNGKISIIDKLKQADIEKLPVDENGIRIADIDGEAIPIGNKNALEKIGEVVENTLEQLKKLGWTTDDINLFNNTFKGTKTLENAKSWKLLKEAGSKYVFKDQKLFEKFTKLNPEVQQYVAKFSDKDANSTLIKFLDDCDDAEFLKFINERPNLSEAFVGHKNSWTHTDFENIAENLTDISSVGVSALQKTQKWIDRSSDLAKFGKVTELGRSLNSKIVNALKQKQGKLFDDLAKTTGIPVQDLQKYDILTEVPLETTNGFMKADVVLILKGGPKNSIQDAIIIENKLSKRTAFTERQKEGFGAILNGQKQITIKYGVKKGKTDINNYLNASDKISISKDRIFKISDGGSDNISKVTIKKITSVK